MKLARCCLLASYSLLILTRLGTARASHKDELPVPSPKLPDIDTVSILRSQKQHGDSMFNEAVRLLDSMKTSPSCNRVAATRLVASCQTFSGGKDSTQSSDPESLDVLRSAYAARLALCEIDGAGTSIPPSCLAVTVSPPPQKTRFGFVNRHRGTDAASDEISREVLEGCLKTLESRPQWWTSYSNSRQNALIICQASRMETEKEELLDLHRAIAKSSIKLNNGLQDALQDAAAQYEQQQEFARAVQGLQEKVTAQMSVTDSLLKRTFGQFLREVEAGINTFQAAFREVLKEAQSGTVFLEKDIQKVSSQVGALHYSLQNVHRETIIRSQEALREQEASAVVNKDLAASLHQSLETLLGPEMEKVYMGMQRFDATMEWLTSRMDTILEQETRMTQHLHHMEEFIQRSESRANDLQKAQDLQTEALSAQNLAHEAIQFHAQVSQALLSKTSASAANLQSAIDNAATTFKHIPGLSAGGLSAWSLSAVLLMVIAVQNIKIAIGLSFLLLGWCTFNGVKHLILTHMLPHLIIVHSFASIVSRFF